jgi:4,5-dihydroxyphthalate decarboxylase
MAIATFMQAQHYGKQLVLLPVVLMNRFHHGSIVKRRGAPLDARALAGTRIGVRAYTQTTGVWVRGILATEYGVDLDAITWVTTEAGHVAEYRDPPNVVRAPEGASLREMLVGGEIDAWIAGRDANGHADALVALFVEAKQRYFDVLREREPQDPEERFRAERLREGIDPLPDGVAALRRSLEVVIGFAHAQRLIPERVTVDSLFRASTGSA